MAATLESTDWQGNASGHPSQRLSREESQTEQSRGESDRARCCSAAGDQLSATRLEPPLQITTAATTAPHVTPPHHRGRAVASSVTAGPLPLIRYCFRTYGGAEAMDSSGSDCARHNQWRLCRMRAGSSHMALWLIPRSMSLCRLRRLSMLPCLRARPTTMCPSPASPSAGPRRLFGA